MPPTPPVELSEDAWRAIRAAYEDEVFTVDAITQQYGVSRDRLYRRAYKEGWAGRRDTPLSAGRYKPPPTPETATTTEKRAALAARLFHALEERIMAIEDEILPGDAAHGERDAKALTAMARALDMLGEMLEAADTGAANPAKIEDQEIDVDEFRNLLTDRLDRLRQGGNE
ncbi:MAG: hypothetical protein ACE360_01915 [Hyphomicrobiales bacterium]